MKQLKRTLALMLALAVLLSASVLCVSVSAYYAGADVKGNTVCEALQMDGAAYMNWLLSHEHDNYYLGTPYAPWDHRNPNGDCKGAYGYFDEKGVAGMNCMGFIWHVLYKATGFSDGKINEVERAMSRMGFYRGLNITRHYFANKEEMLNSGYLEKGDLIWMILDQDEYSDSPYHHIGIYWGDGHSDVLWHSNRVTGGQGECNAISGIFPEVDRNTMYIVLKVGAVTLENPKLTSAVNTDNGITVTWDAVDGAVKYRIFKKAAVGWTYIGDSTGTSYTYTNAVEGEDYLFTVRCITACSKGYTSFYDSRGIRCRRSSDDAPAIETVGDYEYTVLGDGSAQITRYKGADAEIQIPSVIGGHSVTAIGSVDDAYDSAPFSGCSTLTGAVIPDGVTTVGAYAFAGCTALEQVTIPDSVRIIGDGAFGSCTSLASATFPAGIRRIGSMAFGWDIGEESPAPADSFTLYGYTNSPAQRYAGREENAFITFISLGTVEPELDTEGMILGDADGDGVITVFDATAIQRYLVGLTDDGFIIGAADVDSGGGIEVTDATYIQRFLVGLDDGYLIGTVIAGDDPPEPPSEPSSENSSEPPSEPSSENSSEPSSENSSEPSSEPSSENSSEPPGN